MYDYQCDDCGYRFEVRQSFHDDPLTSCPKCTGVVRRVIHPTGVIFKGSGWYITDSRSSGSNGHSSSTVAPAESESSNGQETKAESAKSSSEKKKEAPSSSD
ncbi:MAG: FmdB family zinc ribbon protein [Chloroflexota bacterium]